MRTRAEGFLKRLAGMILAAGAVMLFASPAARAQTCNVNATTDTGAHSSGTTGDILYCVTLANATPPNLSTLITFASSLNGQTITLSSTLNLSPINTGVTINIQGPGANLLTISGANAVQPFSIQSGTVSLSGLTIVNGYSSGGGAAILLSGGSLTVNNAAFSGNTGYVGGIDNLGGSLTVSGSTFSSNNSTFSGGGIYNQSTAMVSNSTFEGNTSLSGGGIANLPGGTLTVTNSTFSGNTGGGIYSSGTLTVSNTIMTADIGGECNGSGCPTNGVTGNLVVQNPAQPILAPLGWYGGQTQTMIPVPGSVAIGAGQVTASDNPSTDQRGLFRKSTTGATIDTGAVQTNYLIVTTTNDTNDGTPGCDSNGDVPCSLRDAMTVAKTAPYISGADIGFAAGVTGAIDLSVINTPLATISGVLDVVGPGANNLTISGSNSANVDAIFALTSATANATISGLTIANGHANINSINCAVEAGGLCTNSGTLTVSNSTVSGNSGAFGGITNSAGTLMVTNSTISGNTGGFGGGIYTGATAIVSGSTVSGNFSSVCGGGIYQVEGTLMVTNSTIAGNTMVNTGGNFGGGICTDHGTLTVINSTISGNIGAAAGGGIYNLYATSLTLSNSIVAGNMNIQTPGDDCDGCGTQTASNLISTPGTIIDPMLASLGNYGGPTQTMLPAPGSPALCLGSAALASSLTTDQRGYSRINTSYSGYSAGNPCVDAGAVETNFQSVQFTNAGNSGYSSTINAAVDEPAAPIVSVIENGQSVGGVALTLGFNGTGAASGLGPVTTVANAGAQFDALTVNSAGDDMLSVTLPLPGGNFLQASASLDVTNSVLTITASDTTTVYGNTPPAPVAGYTYGNVTLSTTPPNGLTAPTCITSATSTTPVGTITGANTCSGASGSNYTISYAPGNVTVGAEPVAITASTTTMTYGGTVPTPSALFTYGSVNLSPTAPPGLTAPTCVTSATSTTQVGTVTGANTCSGASGSNYTISYAAGNLTVGAEPVTITASTTTTTYGGTAPTPSALFTYGSVSLSPTAPAGLTVPTCVTSTNITTSVGTVTGANTCSGASGSNYTISYAPGNVTVSAEPVTITASTTAMIYGGTAPTPSALFTYGSVNLSPTAPPGLTAPTCVTSATNTTPVGTETGANTCAGASGSNYKISYAVGNVMVSADNTTTAIISHTPNPSAVGQAVKVSFTVSPVAPATVTPSGSVTVSDGVGDTCVATVAVGQCNLTISTAGAVTLTATYAGNSNFKGSTSSGVSQNASKAYTCTTITGHTPNPSVTGQPVTVSFTVKPVAPASGTPTGNVVVTDLIGDSCTATVAAGSCSIAFALPGPKLLVATYLGNSNYYGSVTAQIPQNVVDFAVSAGPSTEKVSPGGKTTYTLTLTPVNCFVGTVSLTCGAAPAGSTCALSPSSVTLSGTASKATTATITTAKSTPGGSYTLTFTARYGSGSPSTGGLTHSANVTLTVP